MKYVNLITQEEVETMKRIDEDCKRLHIMPPPKSFLTIEVSNSEKQVKEKLTSLSKSWTRNAYNQLTQQLLGLDPTSHGIAGYVSGGLSQKNTLTGIITADFTSLYDNWGGDINSSAFGIVIGTGSTAESFNDYILATQCTHGTGASQFSHAAGNTSGVWNNSTKKWTSTISRAFYNGSGSTITVAETGIYIKNTSSYYFLYNRDVLSPAVDVVAGDTITVTYTIETTYPA